jgi:cytoskeleton protein RodZ
MAAEAGGDIRAGIGTRLRAAREKKSLTILQAAEKMHVDARILESLEAEDFAALGAPVYARGHLRHYAELVGESPTELQQIYADSTKATPAQPDLTRIARAEPVADSGKLVGPAVIGLVAVGIIGVVWWVFTLSVADKVQPTAVHSKLESNNAGAQSAASQAAPALADTGADDDTTPLVPEPALESTPRGAKHGVGTGAKGVASAPATPNARSAAANTNGTTDSAAQPAGKSTAGTKGAQPPATKLAVATNNASPSAAKQSTATNAAGSSTAKSAAATAAAAATGGTAAAPIPVANVAAPPPAPRAKDGELTLKFSSDSWAEVYDATGQRLFYDVGAAASAHTMRGPAPLRVILGNASGVAVEFNGRPALIPAGVQADGSTRFVINAHGRTVPASPASDGD